MSLLDSRCLRLGVLAVALFVIGLYASATNAPPGIDSVLFAVAVVAGVGAAVDCLRERRSFSR